jgi:glycosyltransferase involved in cell wall biosynthesis
MSDHSQDGLPAIDVSVLFITYNRSDLLTRAFDSLRDSLDFYSMAIEFIVSDDGSAPEHVRVIEGLTFDKRVMSVSNTGLGANCNRGLASSRGEYILQIQDDCLFVGSPDLLSLAISVMRADPEVGQIQLTKQAPTVPHQYRCLADGTRYVVFDNDGISRRRPCGDRPYSDQPHLKRRQFVADIGPYAEGVAMTSMELDYQQRVACQQRWRVAYLPQERSFDHLGAERSFNDSWLRGKRLERIEGYPVVGPIFSVSRPYLRSVRNAWRAIAGE